MLGVTEKGEYDLRVGGYLNLGAVGVRHPHGSHGDVGVDAGIPQSRKLLTGLTSLLVREIDLTDYGNLVV
jgi:hypothetical protein